MNHDDFDAQFKSMSKNIERAHRAALPIAIVSGIGGMAFIGFVCWAIYRLVTHFAG